MDAKSYKEKVFFVLCLTLALTIATAGFGYKVVQQMETIKTDWQNFEHHSVQRVQLLSQIQADLGYGGFIHLFKNFLLHQDTSLIPSIEASLFRLHSAIDKYAAYAISEREYIALTQLRTVLNNYESNYVQARELIITSITADQLNAIISVDDTPALAAIQTLSDTILTRAKHHQTITNQRFDNTQQLVSWSYLLLPVMLISAAVLIYLLRRILRAEKRIQHMAHYDMLTALPNRSLFHDRLRQAILRVERNQTIAALLFMDLDGFKQINDTLGHDAGDKLLKVIARRLQGTIRKTDTVARLGGDEFTVILETVSSARRADMVAMRLIRAIEEPIELRGQTIRVSASVGISICPDDSMSDITLMHCADSAMYLAKQQGKGRFRRYDQKIPSPIGSHHPVLGS
ncbi:GGDEF domain-containing protein [Methylophaga sp. OBS4]|uniref:GGDEF domain-containing protein n=1 Tax=Methylophaga sp. OBS4 TaxID=2991935 RepID=UPI00225B18A1|nr:GGDEF domain-containing protein [Methylophaga sp. OBS4]MCX4186676.1 GGDEF domain-containing protein [Methylophaga sp. OBS4]